MVNLNQKSHRVHSVCVIPQFGLLRFAERKPTIVIELTYHTLNFILLIV